MKYDSELYENDRKFLQEGGRLRLNIFDESKTKRGLLSKFYGITVGEEAETSQMDMCDRAKIGRAFHRAYEAAGKRISEYEAAIKAEAAEASPSKPSEAIQLELFPEKKEYRGCGCMPF